MNRCYLFLCLSVGLAGCSGIQPRGSVTMLGRGAQLLTERGDPLMGTGVYAQRNVPKDYAEGYTAGVASQLHREYLSLQQQQAMPGVSDPPRRTSPTSNPE